MNERISQGREFRLITSKDERCNVEMLLPDHSYWDPEIDLYGVAPSNMLVAWEPFPTHGSTAWRTLRLISRHEPHPFVIVQEHQHRTSKHPRAKNTTGPGFISLREPPQRTLAPPRCRPANPQYCRGSRLFYQAARRTSCSFARWFGRFSSELICYCFWRRMRPRR